MIDPLTVAIVERRLLGISEELGTRCMHSAHSFATAHLRDLGTVIFDGKERVVAQGDWMPVHVAGANVALQGILDYIGRDHIYPGDFIIANDPYIVRFGHLPDWSFMSPFFYEDELLFYFYFRTHQYDGGGAYPGAYFPRGYDIHAEGVIIPPTKIMERGQIQEKTYDVVLKNVRGAAMVRMDNLLIQASMAKAGERLADMCRSYGKEVLKAAVDQIVASTEEMVKKVIAGWPAGTYRSETAADCDGSTRDPVPVNLCLIIKPDEGELVFDFSENRRQVDFINCPLGAVYHSVLTGLLYSLPAGTPRNQGLYNCIKIITKKGTVFDPTYPATCGAQACVLGEEITELVQLALAQAIPRDAPAGWSRHLSPSLKGKYRDVIDPRSGAPKIYGSALMHSDGSSGAIWGYDGWEATAPTNFSGGLLRPPIEVEEWEAPYRWLRYEMLPDSSGHGQFRGGLGTHVEVLNEQNPETYRYGDAFAITGNSDGEKFPPFNLMGATGGKTNQAWIKRQGKLIPLHTMDIVPVLPGDVIITKSTGGGSVGDPLEREIEKVRWDALNGYISLKTAKNVYGVVLDAESFDVDIEATGRLRGRKRKVAKQPANQ